MPDWTSGVGGRTTGVGESRVVMMAEHVQKWLGSLVNNGRANGTGLHHTVTNK